MALFQYSTSAFSDEIGAPQFPDADGIRRRVAQDRTSEAVDVLLVNPPSPDGGIWIRSQHRVGRRSREEMVWPQCSLAQLAAMLHPDYSVAVVDAIAERMSWTEFENLLRRKSPKVFLTQVAAPTLTNDMYGIMLAKSIGSATAAFGTHVTPLSLEMMKDYPALDFVIRGEPELTVRELVDELEQRTAQRPEWLSALLRKSDSRAGAVCEEEQEPGYSRIKGLVWRHCGEVKRNAERNFIPDLNDLPMPLYRLLPLQQYRMPLIKGPFCFVLTSRGCPAGCKYCIKHVSYQRSVRLLAPERIVQEIWSLYNLGIRNIHMYADLFTVNREQVMELCRLILQEGLKIRWTCNSRVDTVDKEMLRRMSAAGCWMISWGIESGNELLLKRAAKGTNPEQAHQALAWSREAGIMNWGYFIIGLPGETVDTIKETICLSKSLPLELALFHIAAPYPGTPFYFEVVEKGWLRKGARWEELDMDKQTVLQYDNLSSDDLAHWQSRAFREWACRLGPAITFAGMLWGNFSTLKRAARIGFEHVRWAMRKDHASS
jgi:anaerobic magnesium-protoporphyrin IX monomethyl ester cyclase